MTIRSTPPSHRLLRQLELFAKCTDDELEFIDNRLAGHHALAGDVLVEAGRTGRELVMIVEGTAVAFAGAREVARFGPGDVVGELALLDHGPRTATVIAVTDVSSLVASGEEFREIFDRVPAFSRALATALARRLRATDELLAG